MLGNSVWNSNIWTFKSGDLHPFMHKWRYNTIRTHMKMILVEQPKHETILEERGDIHIIGNRKYKVWSKKLSRKQVPHNHYWMVWPTLSLLVCNVYVNVGLYGRCFFSLHRLHIQENLCFVDVAKVRTRIHHNTFRRPMRAQSIRGWIRMSHLGRRLPCTST